MTLQHNRNWKNSFSTECLILESDSDLVCNSIYYLPINRTALKTYITSYFRNPDPQL